MQQPTWILLFLLFAGARTGFASIYCEAGDAGDRHHAQTTIANQISPLTNIYGTIGGGVKPDQDLVDAFTFSVRNGGADVETRFEFLYDIHSDAGDSQELPDLFLRLYSQSDPDTQIGTAESPVPDEYRQLYLLGDGEYIVELAAVFEADPLFSITINRLGPLEGSGGFGDIYATSAIPEPATLTLWAIGVVGLALMRRRRLV
jgi:hypothetical protein